MNDQPSDWKISLARWAAWLALCVGMATEIFIVRDAGQAVIQRVLAEQAVRQQDAGRSADIAQLESFLQLDQVLVLFIVGIIVVALTVALDYYLRAGVKAGRLWRRVGLAAGIEAGVLAVALVVQAFI